MYYWDMENNKPTAEQMEALRTFAAANGRTWKSKLNDAWMSGRYSDYPATDRSDLLQQVRNNFGPSWLVRLSLRGEATCCKNGVGQPQCGRCGFCCRMLRESRVEVA